MKEPDGGAKHGGGRARRVDPEDMEVTRKLEHALRTWLRLESTGRAEAESALFTVYRRWPAPQVPAGFSGRVLAAAGLAPAGGRVPVWAWRWGFAVGLVLTLAAGYQAVSLVALAERSGWVANLVGGSFVFLGRRLADLEAAGAALLRAGELLAGSLDSPWTLALCLLAMLVSSVAFMGLQSLLAWDRSGRYANS